MKGNVFSIWLKEFCALVFTQTVQAFILAIILTLIVMTYQRKELGGLSQYVQTQATGVLAIIALTSISKMETLVKKIFGLESSVTDASMKGGRGGVLGSIAAMKMAKNMLNNAPKVAKGVGGRIKAGTDMRRLKLNTANSLSKLDSKQSGGGKINGANATATSNSRAISGGSSINESGEIFDEITSGDTNSTTSSTAASNRLKNDAKYEEKREKIKAEYDKKLAEIKSNKKKATRELLSGITETVGGIKAGTFGLAAGAVAAAGTGDDILATALKGAGIGAGVGDKIGKGAAYVSSPALTPILTAEDVSDTLKLYTRENNKKIKDIEKKMKDFNAGDI